MVELTGTVMADAQARMQPTDREGHMQPVLILDVRLQAVPGAGLLLVPSVGSIIYVHHVTPDVAIMTLPGSLQKLVIETEEASLYECIKDLIAMIRAITVATGTGPSGNVDAIPNNKLALDQLLQKLEKIFLR